MGKFVKVTTVNGEECYMNMDNVDLLLPAAKEDKETRPNIGTYVSVSKGNKVFNLRETPDEIFDSPVIER